MNSDNLVRMANRIGHFFEAMPDREQALADIAGHIRKFWEPRMRQAMLSHLEHNDGEGLTEILRAALTRYRYVWAEGLARDVTK